MHTHVHTHIYSPCCRMKQPLGACWYILFVCEDSSISALCACLICVPCMRALHACLICALCARLLPPQNRNCNRRNRRSAANSSRACPRRVCTGWLTQCCQPWRSSATSRPWIATGRRCGMGCWSCAALRRGGFPRAHAACGGGCARARCCAAAVVRGAKRARPSRRPKSWPWLDYRGLILVACLLRCCAVSLLRCCAVKQHSPMSPR